MGIDAVGVRFLSYCRNSGVDFSDTCTLGRHSLYITGKEIKKVFDKQKISCDQDDIASIMNGVDLSNLVHGFSDSLFYFMGAKKLDAIDASDYEGASIVHDMNKDIEESLFNSYSVVFDGGTLEHVFNFPTAIKNCMKMIRPGGHFVSICPANNFFGHGFYQFSSELFYRVLCPSNGFEIKKLFLSLEKSPDSWYQVPDAATLRERIAFHNQAPTLMLICAQKIADVNVFNEYPQQSDYQEVLWQKGANEHWSAHGSKRVNSRTMMLRKTADFLPSSIVDKARALRPILTGALRHPLRRPNLRRFEM